MYVYDKTTYRNIVDNSIQPSLFVFYAGKPDVKLPIKADMLMEDLVAKTGVDDGFCVIDVVQRRGNNAYWFTGNRIMSISLPFGAGVFVYGVGIMQKTDDTYRLIAWKTVDNEQVKPGADLVISVDLEDIDE